MKRNARHGLIRFALAACAMFAGFTAVMLVVVPALAAPALPAGTVVVTVTTRAPVRVASAQAFDQAARGGVTRVVNSR